MEEERQGVCVQEYMSVTQQRMSSSRKVEIRIEFKSQEGKYTNLGSERDEKNEGKRGRGGGICRQATQQWKSSSRRKVKIQTKKYRYVLIAKGMKKEWRQSACVEYNVGYPAQEEFK